MADCGGVGRDFPWSIEKLSPTLAFFVVDGIEAGANKCEEILQFGGMGHTAGMHTASREAAIRYGEQMPASRVIINSPTTHGAIGFSTDLSPSMTLGCGSWGGNVTSDNVSPIHLMDIKRVAFETKAVGNRESKAENQHQSRTSTFKFQNEGQRPISKDQKPKREEIAAIVDKFLSQKLSETTAADSLISLNKVERNESGLENQPTENPVKTIIHEIKPQSQANGAKPVAVDFVSENDVRDAIEKGEKVYITAKTILTPSARDLGEEKEVFAKI